MVEKYARKINIGFYSIYCFWNNNCDFYCIHKEKINKILIYGDIIKKYKKTPDDWIKGKLDESNVECDLKDEVSKFADWAGKKLNLKSFTPGVAIRDKNRLRVITDPFRSTEYKFNFIIIKYISDLFQW